MTATGTMNSPCVCIALHDAHSQPQAFLLRQTIKNPAFSTLGHCTDRSTGPAERDTWLVCQYSGCIRAQPANPSILSLSLPTWRLEKKINQLQWKHCCVRTGISHEPHGINTQKSSFRNYFCDCTLERGAHLGELE